MAFIGLRQFLAIFIAFAVLTAATACSDPYEYTLPPDVSKWAAHKRLHKTIDKLPEPERTRMQNFV
ncbi:hypothetical protein KDL45_18145, partial [bacterium]|nr:hypothetical protein [bacterium]